MLTKKILLFSIAMSCMGLISMHNSFSMTPNNSPIETLETKQVAQILWDDVAPFPKTREYNQRTTLDQKRLITKETRDLVTEKAQEEVHNLLRKNPLAFYENYKTKNISKDLPAYAETKNKTLVLRFSIAFAEEYKRIGEKMSYFMPAVERIEAPGLSLSGYMDLQDQVERFIAK